MNRKEGRMQPEGTSRSPASGKAADPDLALRALAKSRGLLQVLVPLLLGLGCYMLFRPDSKFYLGYAIQLPVAAGLIANLPDGLWAYAFCQALFLCPGSRPARDSLTVVLFGTVYELLQGILIPGSPSFLDVVYYSLASIAAFILQPKTSIHEH